MSPALARFSVFSAQPDRYFQSAISAYRLNQPKVGKKHIQTMRELIKKEHAGADREDDKDKRERRAMTATQTNAS